MARRKALTGPYSKVTSANVFPVVPLRNQLATAVSNTVVTEELDLNLQFENNEVFDVMKVEAFLDVGTLIANPGHTRMDVHCGLLDNPASVVNLDTAAVFETTPELFAYFHQRWQYWEELIYSAQVFKGDHFVLNFEEPFTVARNIIWSLVAVDTIIAGASAWGAVTQLRGIVWGRRRRASDSEFKDIIYRERF